MSWRSPAPVPAVLVAAAVAACGCLPAGHAGRSSGTVVIRGQAQTLRLYGDRGGIPVIVSSGDGGWIHLGPHIAETLAARGCFVVGFDVRRYLTQFTSAESALRPDDVAGDYQVLVDFAARGSAGRPVLVGVSEGAGLSVLAGADARLHATVAGVVGIGLPAVNELGWRWRDSIIYLTHGIPNEPTFSTAQVIGRVAPLPLAAIQSTHDEFVSAEQARLLMARASEPRRLWIVEAGDHRFSDNLPVFDARLVEALTWIRERTAH